MYIIIFGNEKRKYVIMLQIGNAHSCQKIPYIGTGLKQMLQITYNFHLQM